MKTEIKSLMSEVDALQERFLESGEQENEIQGTDGQTQEEKGEAKIFAEMLRNSVHSSKELVKLMLNPEHETYVKSVMGESGVEKLKSYGESLEAMHQAIHEALGDDQEEEEEEEEPDNTKPDEQEGDENEGDREEELDTEEKNKVEAASKANEEAEEEEEEEGE